MSLEKDLEVATESTIAVPATPQEPLVHGQSGRIAARFETAVVILLYAYEYTAIVILALNPHPSATSLKNLLSDLAWFLYLNTSNILWGWSCGYVMEKRTGHDQKFTPTMTGIRVWQLLGFGVFLAIQLAYGVWEVAPILSHWL